MDIQKYIPPVYSYIRCSYEPLWMNPINDLSYYYTMLLYYYFRCRTVVTGPDYLQYWKRYEGANQKSKKKMRTGPPKRLEGYPNLSAMGCWVGG